MAELNYDIIRVKPDTKHEMLCKVCNSLMDKTPYNPNKWSGNGWASAIAKFNSVYDEFFCPNSSFDWHKKSLKLLVAIDNCPSPSLKEIMQKDLKIMLKIKI